MASLGFVRDRTLIALLFFIACPVMIGFPMGWYQAGLGRYLPPGASCGLWVSQWLLTWWMSEALLRGAKAILRPWNLPFLALLVLAALGNIALARFWGPLLNSLFLTLGGVEDQSVNGASRNLLDLGYVFQLFRASAYGAVYWCVLRFAYERYLTHVPVAALLQPITLAPITFPTEETQTAWPLRFTDDLRKVGIVEPQRVVAVQAEDHYIRVHVEDGSSRLIYRRFADALKELKSLDGMQVHRSFWVKRSAIANALTEQGKLRLHLAGGLVVPVSHKHRALIEFMLNGSDKSLLVATS
jgi:hypothetical protein